MPIFLTAICVRLPALWQDALMNDEMSGWVRSRFHSFSELIQLGIIPDGHPALSQIILWLTPSEFPHPFWMRLPFFMAGIACIPIFFKSVSTRYGLSPALWSTAALAFLQLFVFHGQTARPYSMGLLGVLCCYLGLGSKSIKNNSFLVFIGIVVAAYSHYFALLQIIILIVIRFFGDRKTLPWKPIFLAFLCFSPHFYITLSHFSMKGLGWLSPPSWYFLPDYLAYLFHFSWYLILISLLGFILCVKQVRTPWSELLAFVLPFLILWTYSNWRAPVLQFSALLFSTPFLLVFLSYGTKTLNVKSSTLFLILFSLMTLGSLWWERKHDAVMSSQPFARGAEYLNNNDTLIFGEINSQYLEWAYFQHHRNFPKYHAITIDSLLPETMKVFSSNPAQRAALALRYKNVSPLSFGFTHEHIQGDQLLTNSNPILKSKYDLQYLHIKEEQWIGEFGPSIKMNFPADTRFLHIGAGSRTKDSCCILVIEIKRGEKTIRSISSPIQKWPSTGLRMEDVLLPWETGDGLSALVYLWDPSLKKSKTSDLHVWLWKGNPFRYGTVEPIP